jgi:formate/nitrite transporter FocA (FNT family)
MIEPKLLKLIDSFFQLLFFLSLVFMAGVIIYLGIIYITTSGDKLKEVHKKLPLLLIGAVFIFLSLTIPKLIELFFK